MVRGTASVKQGGTPAARGVGRRRGAVAECSHHGLAFDVRQLQRAIVGRGEKAPFHGRVDAPHRIDGFPSVQRWH